MTTITLTIEKWETGASIFKEPDQTINLKQKNITLTPDQYKKLYEKIKEIEFICSENQSPATGASLSQQALHDLSPEGSPE